MSKIDFSKINKKAADSFNIQRNLIKRIAQGETVLCSKCSSTLHLNVSKLTEPGITCSKGCTSIALEIQD